MAQKFSTFPKTGARNLTTWGTFAPPKSIVCLSRRWALRALVVLALPPKLVEGNTIIYFTSHNFSYTNTIMLIRHTIITSTIIYT
jgi:hypothetical protein